MTNEDRKMMNDVCVMVATVQELGMVPNGHLYATLMGLFSYDDYMMRLAVAKQAGWLEESGNVLSCTAKGAEVGKLVNKALAAKV